MRKIVKFGIVNLKYAKIKILQVQNKLSVGFIQTPSEKAQKVCTSRGEAELEPRISITRQRALPAALLKLLFQ